MKLLFMRRINNHMPKIPLTASQLQSQLDDQIEFIIRSCDAFDVGCEAEAKRLAVALRILIHDKGNSKSLLGQLGKLDRDFFDTLMPMPGTSLIPEMGLVFTELGLNGVRYVAPLDNVSEHSMTQFDQWWNAEIFKVRAGEYVSRRLLVMTAADQDGGAHVDASLDELYHRLVHENALGWTVVSNSESESPMGDPTRATLRQIAHEVLKTLVEGYEKMYEPQGTMFGQTYISTEPHPSLKAIHFQGPNGTNTPDNAECPCGSGNPYKGCHNRA